MTGDFALKNFLKDLGMRLGAAAVVVGIFFGLGYLNRINFFGFSTLLDSQSIFFGTAFGLIGLASLTWIIIQYYLA